MKKIPVNRLDWSEQSKRSYAFHGTNPTYEDLVYICRHCEQQAVFTAEEQRISYEVKKQYIGQRRVLCSSCNGELYRLMEREKEFQLRWSMGRETLKTDREFLVEWLAILQTIPGFKQRTRSGMRGMLERLLEELAASA
jgi:hypothetical protein